MIERLNQGEPGLDAQIAFHDPANGQDRRCSASELLGLLGSTQGATQYFAPSAAGFAVTVRPVFAGDEAWLLMTPTGALASGTITLPSIDELSDRQRVRVTTTQAITALTVAGNGAQVNNAPTTLAAGGFFTLMFDGVLRGWYRVG